MGDLIVMVQEKEQAAIDPVRQLGNQLVWEGILALVGMLLTVTSLWFVVLRLSVDTRDGARQKPAPRPPIRLPYPTLKPNSTER